MRHAHDDHRWVTLAEASDLTVAPADIPILARLCDWCADAQTDRTQRSGMGERR